MAKLVGRRPIEIKLYDQQDGRVPVFDSNTRLWTTMNKADIASGSAITSGSNRFIGDQIITGSVYVSSSLTVGQGITGDLIGTASYASNAWAIGGNTFSGGSPERIIGTLSDHNLAIYASGSRVATFTSSGSLLISPNLPNNLNNEKILIDAGETTSFNLIRALATIDNYSQFNINNQSTGSTASSDIVATADNGSETTNFIDMGINSSGFSGEVGDANDAYLYSTGNDLHIGNASNHPVQFFAGGLDNNANRKLQLNPNNLHQMTGSLDVSGSIVAQSFTGSLEGTSSVAVSSSYALTASYVENAQTASYVLQAVSASYALTASNAPDYLPLAGGTLTGDLYAAGRTFWYQDLILGYGTSFGKITTDGTKYISIMPEYNVESARFWPNGNVTIQNGGTYVDNGFRLDVSGSGRFTNGLTITGSLQAINGITGSLLGTASQASTASSADDFTVRGTLTAQTIVAQTITSSIDFVTGSTRNGSLLSNTHQFTGSVTITGSLSVNGSDYITTSGSTSTRLTNLETFSGSYNTGSFTGSFIGRHTGSFSGSLHNLQNSIVGHIPFFSSSQVLADSIAMQIDNGGGSYSIAINQNGVTTSAPEALYVWQPSETSYNVISGKGNLDNYLQLNIQNTNTGPSASSDVVATANNGTETTYYVDMGINNENYINNGNGVGNANDAYLYSTGNHLHIGNASNSYVGFFAGGFDVDANMKLLLSPDNKHEVTGSLTVTEGITGSLHGTASWASNSLNANTASYVENAQSASYWSGSIVNAATASYVLQAQSASYWSGSITNAESSSYASNADLLDGKDSTIFATTGSNSFKSNQVITGSLTATSFISGSSFNDVVINRGKNNDTTNIAVGEDNLINNNVGANNTAVGRGVLTANQDGSNNTAVGRSALVANTDGSFNVAFGFGALSSNTSGGRNTAIGYNAGVGLSIPLTSGFNNIFLGSRAEGEASNESNRTWIGNIDTETTWLGGELLLGTRLSSGGIYRATIIGNTKISGSLITTGSIISTNGFTGSLLGTASYAAQALTASYWSGSVINAATASYVLQSVSASYASTASSADDFIVRGTLTAQTIVAQTITSSVEFVTGSTHFGSIISNTHQFTGSVSTSGSLLVNNSNVILTNQTSSMSVLSASYANTASYIQNAQSASYWSGSIINAASSSYASNADLLDGKDSTIFSTTGSNQFTGSQSILGSLTVTGSISQQQGYIILSQVSQSLNFVDDADAAAGGVPLGGLYRNGNFILIRII